MSAYDIDDARSCAESLYMTRTVAAVDAVAGSAVADHRAERWAAERTRREASASGSIRYCSQIGSFWRLRAGNAVEAPGVSRD